MTLSKKEEASVLKVYKTYFDSYTGGDVENITSLLTESYTQIGSAEAEVFANKKDAVKFLHDTINQVAGKAEMRNRVLKAKVLDGYVLIIDLFDMYVLMEDEWSFYAKLRASTLMQKTESGWKFVYQHSSMPDTRAEDGNNLAIEKISAENQQLREAVKRRTIELEGKNRELEIEAALERVRNKAITMRSSEELADVVITVFHELQKMDMALTRCLLWLFNQEDQSAEVWMANSEDPDYADSYHIPNHNHPAYKRFLKGWKSQESKWEYHLKGKNKAKWDEILVYGYFKSLPAKVKKAMKDPAQIILSGSFNKYGVIQTAGLDVLSNENQEILRRFSQIFEQTYTRFLDLQKAESQAREAQIETALERVRSKTMAMHNSDDVGVTVVTLFDEVLKLGLDNDIRCGIGILEGTERMETRSATLSPDGEVDLKMGMLDMTIHPLLKRIKKAWKRGGTRYRDQMIGKDVIRYYTALNNEPDYPFFVELDTLPEKEFHNSFSFSEGILFAFSPNPMSEEAAKVLNRFASVFGQTYRRYLDLINAEAQAREAQIEAALERVRARALAMQQPDELMEVAKVLRQEMGVLGVEELETSSIYINDEQAERAECWYALKDIRKRKKRLVSDHFALDLNDTWVGRQMLKFYKADNERTSIVMEGKNRIEWIRYCEEKSIPFRGYYGDIIPDRTYQLFKFSHGAVGAATPGDISDEHWGLLKRAAAVFSLAYSRFKDLSQAREDLQKLKEEKHRAENALTELKSTQSQLVHAEKMASLGELTAGIAHEIQNPLNFVNNFSEVSRELVEEINEEIKAGNLDEVKFITTDLKQNLEKINHHGQRASGIVKGMLEHSRTGSSKKELTDINKLADEYLRLSYHGLRAKEKSFNADFKSDFEETLPQVKVIAQDLGRVILNLINNAFYAVSEKAKVSDDGKYKPIVKVSTSKLNAAVEIIVQDNGQGIPKEIVDKIFQPFFTTKPSGSGTGLGLSMSYDIITKGHGGELQVESRREKELNLL